jgi:NADH-quinone oxidoreductase subunit L
MAVPLVVLAFGSIVAGYLGVPEILHGANRFEHFLAPSFEAPSFGDTMSARAAMEPGNGSLGLMLMIVASILPLAGIAFAAKFYLKRPGTAERLAAQFPGLDRFLLNKGYVDELYDAAIVQPVKALANGALWRGLDVRVIDGAVNGTGTMVVETGGALRKVQTGSMRAYAVSVLVGVVTIIGYYLWR